MAALERKRREPPPFRLVGVRRVEYLTPFMARVTFGGIGLDGLVIKEPAASVRLLLPEPGADLVVPTWSGNEFLLPDGGRPLIRTFTPRYFRVPALELDLDIVLHAGGAASNWVKGARVGDPAAVSGPARGYVIDPAAGAFLLAGDETAIPAMAQLVDAIAPDTPIELIAEIGDPAARVPLPEHPRLKVTWAERSAAEEPGSALVPAVAGAPITAETRIWAAGEAGAMHRIRQLLFVDRGITRSDATVRGYWKHGR